jgi:hypothetical protein
MRHFIIDVNDKVGFRKALIDLMQGDVKIFSIKSVSNVICINYEYTVL